MDTQALSFAYTLICSKFISDVNKIEMTVHICAIIAKPRSSFIVDSGHTYLCIIEAPVVTKPKSL